VKTSLWHKVCILARVLRYWRRFPHLRLGQLLVNAVESSATHGKMGWPPADLRLFYRADEGVCQDLWILDLYRQGLLKPTL